MLCSFCSVLETQASNNGAHCHYASISHMPWSSPGRLQVWLHWQKQFFALLRQWHDVSNDAGTMMRIVIFVSLVLHHFLQCLHEIHPFVCSVLLPLSLGYAALVHRGVFDSTVRTWVVLLLCLCLHSFFSLAANCTICHSCQIFYKKKSEVERKELKTYSWISEMESRKVALRDS